MNNDEIKRQNRAIFDIYETGGGSALHGFHKMLSEHLALMESMGGGAYRRWLMAACSDGRVPPAVRGSAGLTADERRHLLETAYSVINPDRNGPSMFEAVAQIIEARVAAMEAEWSALKLGTRCPQCSSAQLTAELGGAP